MPIFHIKQPECVFVHVPKTGGNTIRNVVFERQYEGPWFGDRLPDDWQSLFSFGFVRNPFDRVVSAWKMFCEGTVDDAWNLPEGKALNLSLHEVLQLGLDPQAAFGHPRYNGVKPDAMIRLKNHIIPQTHPYHGLQLVEFIGRFETLQKDFDHICERLAIPSVHLPRTNWTSRSGYQDYFDPNSRALAEELYQHDLKEFGYRYE